MFVRRPYTNDLFRQLHSPSFAWVLPFDDADDKTVAAANKQEASNEKTKSASNDLSLSKSLPLAPHHIDPRQFDVAEEDGCMVLSTDLPGVKHADLKVEFQDGSLHIEASRKKGSKKHSFVRHLTIDEDAIDVHNLSATLEDGILTIKAPKAQKAAGEENIDSRKLIVTKTSPPEDPAELNLEIDLPGVRVEDLEIHLAKNGMLSVFAERKHGKSQRPTKMTEAYMLNPRKVETSKLEAFLLDGLLTIRAPAKVHVTKTVAVNGKMPPTDTTPEKTVEEEKKKGQ